MKKSVSKKAKRERSLYELRYPHYAPWRVLRYVLKAGAQLKSIDGKCAGTVKQIIKPTIPGDTPTLIVEAVEVEGHAQR